MNTLQTEFASMYEEIEERKADKSKTGSLLWRDCLLVVSLIDSPLPQKTK
jgi:hypothetical protein